jgi:hypothetical protein
MRKPNHVAFHVCKYTFPAPLTPIAIIIIIIAHISAFNIDQVLGTCCGTNACPLSNANCEILEEAFPTHQTYDRRHYELYEQKHTRLSVGLTGWQVMRCTSLLGTLDCARNESSQDVNHRKIKIYEDNEKNIETRREM